MQEQRLCLQSSALVLSLGRQLNLPETPNKDMRVAERAGQPHESAQPKIPPTLKAKLRHFILPDAFAAETRIAFLFYKQSLRY